MTPTPAALLTLDTLLRGAALALLLLLAALLWRFEPRDPDRRLSAAFALGVACYTLRGMPGLATWPVWLAWPVVAVESANGFLFWLLARNIFDDDFALRPWHAVPWLVMAALGGVSCGLLHPNLPVWAGWINRLLPLTAGGLALHAVGQMLWQWRTDLVERRRRWRLLLVGLTVPATLVNVATRLLQGGTPVSAEFRVLDAAWVLLAVTLVAWHLLGVQAVADASPHLSAPPSDADPAPQSTTPAPMSAPTPAAGANVPPEQSVSTPSPDQAWIDQLQQLMTREEVFREPSLTIGALADRMGLLEYQLRRLINQRLGYRNFNAFLNHYRLADACRALADPQRAQWTVLKVATEAGYQSLGPFNRAFKTETGVTPTAYRQQHLGTHHTGV